MKDKSARALAIIALVFMAIFVAMLITTIVDHTLLGGSVGYIALGTGVMVLVMLLALKADGRGFSMTKINNEIEMQKIEKELADRAAREQAEKEKADGENNADEKEPSVEDKIDDDNEKKEN